MANLFKFKTGDIVQVLDFYGIPTKNGRVYFVNENTGECFVESLTRNEKTHKYDYIGCFKPYRLVKI